MSCFGGFIISQCGETPALDSNWLSNITDLNVLNAMLLSAQAAYGQLVMGKMVATIIDANGQQVQFSRPDATLLESYIGKIQGRINDINNPRGAIRGPLRMVF